jgi:hypothetical protein
MAGIGYVSRLCRRTAPTTAAMAATDDADARASSSKPSWVDSMTR